MTRRQIALENKILRGVVGSTAHGTGLAGQEDRDEMGVCIEPPEYVCGLRKFDQYIYRDKPEGVRSEPGDLDLTIYGLRKFVGLAAQGNPSILVLLWLPEYMTITDLGQQLVDLRGAFVSQESGRRFLGYLVSQKKRLTGERSKKVSRPDLVEQFGYDTKFAMHALRLGLQGLQYMTEGTLIVPMPEPARSILLDVRSGKTPFEETLSMIERTERQLAEAIERCNMVADYARINQWLVEAHRAHWDFTP